MRTKIRKIAHQVRRDVLNLKEYKSNLQGACGISSWHLITVLRIHNIEAKYVISIGHCWAETDRYAIDVTATQFDKSCNKVMIRLKSTYYDYDFVYGDSSHKQVTKYSTSALQRTLAWDRISDTQVKKLKERQRFYRAFQII